MSMMRVARPEGWGIGVNLLDEHGGPLAAEDRVEMVARELAPDWMQTWTLDRGNERCMPAWESATGDLTERELAAIDGRTVLLLNEPETGAVGRPLADPLTAAQRTCEAVEYLRRCGIRFNWCAPNCNINGANLIWLGEYARALMDQGYVPHLWGVHVYAQQVAWAREHWTRFLNWHSRWGEDRPVVITEGGAGSRATVEQHVAMMRWLRRLMDGPPVVGVAYFAAFGYEHGQRQYLGVMDTPALADEWRRL